MKILNPTVIWQRAIVKLKNTRHTKHTRSAPEIIVRALILEIKSSHALEPIFEIDRREKFGSPIRAGEHIQIELRFFLASDVKVNLWLEALKTILTLPSSNFAILDDIVVEKFQLDLNAVWDREIPQAEVCLNFLTPLSFATSVLRTRIKFSELRENLMRRCQSLLDFSPTFPSNDLQALDHLWHFHTGLHHASKSERGHEYTLNGCIGTLFLRGQIGPWLSWLKLASLLHLGKRTNFGLGRFNLLLTPPPVFDQNLGKFNLLLNALHHVMDNHDDAAIDIAATQAQFDEITWCQQFQTRIQRGEFAPLPNLLQKIPKPNGEFREIEQLNLESLVAARHLTEILAPKFDQLFEPSSIAYRKGYSRKMALDRIESALHDGFEWVVKLDIDDFFSSVDFKILQQQLERALPQSDVKTRALLNAIIHTHQLERGEIKIRERGLAQGSPLSPLLANLYLDQLDDWFAAQNIRATRYADDILLLCRQQDEADHLLTTLQTFLAQLKLQLETSKTQIVHASLGFEFLGYRFPRVAQDDALPKASNQALHITEPYAFLGINGDAISIRVKGELREVIPMRRISEIYLHAPASLSSALMQKCARQTDGIPIVLADLRAPLQLKPDTPNSFATAHRHASHYESLSCSARCVIAKSIASQKIFNTIGFWRSRYRKGDNQFLIKLEQCIVALEMAADIHAVRGHEAQAAQIHFKAFADAIEVTDFAFKKRQQKDPDRINSLLNFAYSMLAKRISMILRGLGLNPYLGFLHQGETEPTYELLVYDLLELFRAYADRLVLKLVNLKMISADEFETTPKGLRLNRNGARKFILQYERELLKPFANQPLCLNDVMYAQCLNVKAYVLEQKSWICHAWSAKE